MRTMVAATNNIHFDAGRQERQLLCVIIQLICNNTKTHPSNSTSNSIKTTINTYTSPATITSIAIAILNLIVLISIIMKIGNKNFCYYFKYF